MEKGRIIGGKYRILERIGRGGCAAVYLAEDLRLGTKRAVKYTERPGNAGGGFREGEILKNLNHPAFPGVIDRWEDEQGIFLVMEYIKGKNLETWLKSHGPFDAGRIWKWAGELCDALQYLHGQEPPVLYLDLKPSNLILDGEGRLRLVDFGIAERENDCPSLAGSRNYAAPEQLQPGNRQDARTDLYALGITLYRLATGRFPQKNRKKRRMGNLSPGLARILRKCMEEEPGRRFSSCKALERALRTCREGREEREQYRVKRRRILLTAAAAGIALGAGLRGARAEEKQYQAYLREAEGPGSAKSRTEACIKAVGLRRDAPEGYRLLLEIFREDGSFTAEEEEIFLQAAGQLTPEFKRSSAYRGLAYQAGRLYWYYYSYGQTAGEENGLIRMRAAAPWFREASGGPEEWADSAKRYAQIGYFFQELQLQVREGTEQKNIRELWEQLQELEAQSREEVGAERLELLRLCFRTVRIWQTALKLEGISREEQELFLDRLWEAAEKLEPGSSRERQMLEEISRERKIAAGGG